MNIYLVEDNPFIALTLKKMINGLGHRVCGTAASYEKAVDDLSSLKPDLVLTDILIEGPLTGIDLAKYINSNLHIPFIYQSSITADDMIEDAHSTHPEAYLTKPVSKQQLLEALSTCELF